MTTPDDAAKAAQTQVSRRSRPGIVIVYAIRRRTDGKPYVGLTARHKEDRFRAHCADAMRNGGSRGQPGTITHAIREVISAGLDPREHFTMEVLVVCADLEEARQAEAKWIERLNTAAPSGFNVMPGGASVGGPGNAKKIVILHPKRGELRFAAISDAVADISRERMQGGQPPLSEAVVRARLDLGWPPAEAFELVRHPDGRSKRPLFLWHGRHYDSLRELARVEGLRIDTARSRLHRAWQAGCGAHHDASLDRRRRFGPTRRPRAARLALPDPRSPTAPTVNAATFARLTGIPNATVLARWQAVRRRIAGGTALDRAAVLTKLQGPVDRRVAIALDLPDGRRLEGGVREVVRAVLADAKLKWGRPECLGRSAIRARLRCVPGWPNGPLSADAVAWSFGFNPSGRYRRPRRVHVPDAGRRRAGANAAVTNDRTGQVMPADADVACVRLDPWCFAQFGTGRRVLFGFAVFDRKTGGLSWMRSPLVAWHSAAARLAWAEDGRAYALGRQFAPGDVLAEGEEASVAFRLCIAADGVMPLTASHLQPYEDILWLTACRMARTLDLPPPPRAPQTDVDAFLRRHLQAHAAVRRQTEGR